MPNALTQARLKELLTYDRGTGHFAWRIAYRGREPGDRAGYRMPHGYILVGIDGRRFTAHRLAWLYEYGRWPKECLDHINGDESDNRLVNLRECTHAENHQNGRVRKDNRLGLTGVCYNKRAGRFQSEITLNGKRYRLGYFDTPEEAHAAYLQAKAQLHQFQPTPRLYGRGARQRKLAKQARRRAE